jgi:peptidoglycan hydrolase-like protein with peptidoglycan-binding domain
LQKRLQLEGYLTSTPNGYYGAGTTAAVKEFQRDYNLKQTGAVGPGTRAALNAE